MNPNIRATEKVALVGTIDPGTVNNVEKFTDVIDMSKAFQVMGLALLGDMANETIDFKAYTCDGDGNNAVALKAATQLAASAAANDAKQIAINVRAEELQASGKQHIKFGLVTGAATGGPAAVVVLATDLRMGWAADADLSSVVQIKV